MRNTLYIYLVALCLLLSKRIFCQKNIDCGKLSSLIASCKDSSAMTGDSIMYKIPEICNSKNEIEIRLSVLNAPLPNFDLFILTYNADSNWQLKKLTYPVYSYDKKDLMETKILNSKSVKSIFHLFNKLKRNHIFNPPQMSKIKVYRTVLDGTLCSVRYKVGGKFGLYHFDNPDIYIKHTNNRKVFRKYNKILKLFYNSFKD